MNQPELPVDPPAEIEVDSELTQLIEEAHLRRRQLQGIGVDLEEANLLTPREDRRWEFTFGEFEKLLTNAAGRVAKVSADRREAEADGSE